MQNTSTTKHVHAWDRDVLAEFATGHDDVLVVERPVLDNIAQTVEKGLLHDYLAVVTRANVEQEARTALRELELNSLELETDINRLLNSFLDQFDLQSVNFRIEIVESRSCPKFHCDNVNVRMVTTYFGAATEYKYNHEEIIRSASTGGLVFMKGHQYPTHQNNAVHRSPDVQDGERRLCVVIDF